MERTNLSSLSRAEFEDLLNEIAGHAGLQQVLAWAVTKPKDEVHPNYVAEVITQDEFMHDVVVPYRNIFLVYGST